MRGPVVGDEVKSQGGTQIQGCPGFFGIDSTPPHLVAFKESDPFPGMGFLGFGLFIFFPVKENEPKENARVPLYPARRFNDRLPRAARVGTRFSQTGRYASPVRIADARRGTKGRTI
jgi:hypothetical protein